MNPGTKDDFMSKQHTVWSFSLSFFLSSFPFCHVSSLSSSIRCGVYVQWFIFICFCVWPLFSKNFVPNFELSHFAVFFCCFFLFCYPDSRFPFFFLPERRRLILFGPQFLFGTIYLEFDWFVPKTGLRS